jgi:hypothetical protein
LGKTLATHGLYKTMNYFFKLKLCISTGLEKELHILCEDLLGPTHSSAQLGSSWAPKISVCINFTKFETFRVLLMFICCGFSGLCRQENNVKRDFKQFTRGPTLARLFL